MLITSLENPKIKYLSKLDNSRFRKKEAKFIVEGKHLVDEARKANLLIEAYSTIEKEGYITVTEAIMKKISKTDTTVSEIGLCNMKNDTTLSSKILLLDGIQDPGNMGALMRSAKAFGFDTIILGDGSVDIYNDKVIRSSQGAIFKLSFIQANIKDFILNHKEYKIYGTNVINGIPMEEVLESDKFGIVLGNEGNGISPIVNEVIEKNIYIPMFNTESLNVSVAGGILMYHFRKK